MNEEWKPVVGWEGTYSVSNLGRVRSEIRTIIDSRGHVRNLPGQILKPHVSYDGHCRVNLTLAGRGQEWRSIHRLVLESFVGPSKLIVCHWNGDPADNRLSNLRYGTYSDNNTDTVRHGRNYEANKTHCPRGHPLEIPNLTVNHLRVGHRSCLACSRAQAYLRRHPDASFDAVAEKYFTVGPLRARPEQSAEAQLEAYRVYAQGDTQ